MRVIRLLLFSALFLFLLVWLISLFIPSHVRISRAIDLAADRASVMRQVSEPARWKQWFPGLEKASLLAEEGKTNGVILDNKNDHLIRILHQDSLHVVTEMKNGARRIESGWQIVSTGRPQVTTLQWYLDFKLAWYPWEKFASLLFEKSYGAVMDQGLQNLQKTLTGGRSSL